MKRGDVLGGDESLQYVSSCFISEYGGSVVHKELEMFYFLNCFDFILPYYKLTMLYRNYQWKKRLGECDFLLFRWL